MCVLNLCWHRQLCLLCVYTSQNSSALFHPLYSYSKHIWKEETQSSVSASHKHCFVMVLGCPLGIVQILFTKSGKPFYPSTPAVLVALVTNYSYGMKKHCQRHNGPRVLLFKKIYNTQFFSLNKKACLILEIRFGQ